MKELHVDRLISWDKQTARLLPSYPAILVEVRWVPGSGNGYLIARHPSSNKSDIRWNADGSVQGRINANTFQQVVQGGTILELHPDSVNPRVDEWVVAVSPFEINYAKPRSSRRAGRGRK